MERSGCGTRAICYSNANRTRTLVTTDGRRPLTTGPSLADQAYAVLRELITSGELPPGERLTERGLAGRLGVSPTPVREAIKRLALENLVTVFPRRGTFASEINITDLAHISDVRTQLEGHAAYRAAERLTDVQRAAQLARQITGQLRQIDAGALHAICCSCRASPESMGFAWSRCQSRIRRSLMTISTICGTVSTRPQSRCSSQASDTQPIGLPPA